MSQLTPFVFESNQLRVINDEHGEPWFVASDVAKVLDYSEASAMTRHLDEDERRSVKLTDRGQDQNFIAISESGLYSAILKSRKPEAKKFKKWVTSEVLPSIRKTGSYTDPSASFDPSTLTRMDILQMAIESEQGRLKAEATCLALETEIKAQAPKLEYANSLIQSSGTLKINDVAKSLGYPVLRMYSALREKGVLLTNNEPAAQLVAKGYFECIPYSSKNGTHTGVFAAVTGRGVEFIRRFALRNQDICGKSIYH